MATTETRTGFRLPWSSEPRTADETPEPAAAAGGATSESVAGADSVEPTSTGPGEPTTDAPTPSVAEAQSQTTAVPTGPTASETDAQVQAAYAPVTTAPQAVDGPALPQPTPEAEKTSATMIDTFAAPSARPASTITSKRPTKFLADLTRAMQAAAEAERSEILERFQAETKAYVEQIQERSSTEATELQKLADDDVAGIRDWSKAEIARIREETDERIAHRKSRLDSEIEAHAARIQREIERVKSTVDGFEADMTRFFEGLMNEDDPTSFAERAANLPGPPSLDDVVASVVDERPEPAIAPTAPVSFRTTEAPAPATIEASEPVVTPVAEPATTFEEDPPISHETPSAQAAAQAVGAEAPEAQAGAPTSEAETSATETPATETPATETPATEAPAPQVDPIAPVPATSPDGELTDPRVAALGLTPDFAAAEAEARANVEGDGDDDSGAEEIPALDDDTIAARLAGLPQVTPETAEETRSTQVVVTGLVSVASIAGFKRHLSRIPGVKSVGVSSGPEGEFLFTVTHGEDVALHETIPTLPGFAARITSSGEGVLNVAAHDPETDA